MTKLNKESRRIVERLKHELAQVPDWKNSIK